MNAPDRTLAAVYRIGTLGSDRPLAANVMKVRQTNTQTGAIRFRKKWNEVRFLPSHSENPAALGIQSVQSGQGVSYCDYRMSPEWTLAQAAANGAVSPM
ncbi:MAG: hypothetical protein ACJAZ1_001575 [Yoonia sp.]|jgi:hypothetical protein